MKNKYPGILLMCWLMVIIVCTSHAQNISTDEIHLTIPRNVILNMIEAALPLNLEKGPYFKGDLWIHTIEHLTIGSDKVAFDMNLRGNNIKFETRLGRQALLMDIGDLNVVFNCTLSLRYDPPNRLLYITPYLSQKQDKNNGGQIAANLLQLLSLANGVEYAMEIKKFQPVITQICNDQFHIDLHLTSIHTESGTVHISGQPKLRKIPPPTPS
ncbi:hypothetical protein [Desulfobacula sp.]|uniref:hypothetical protein n=1 Tax=Desulfobacula sp. TaxID=2593537 RepID=UPI00261EEDA6|nr:hypothetical protein [Desulfobacula sp.]